MKLEETKERMVEGDIEYSRDIHASCCTVCFNVLVDSHCYHICPRSVLAIILALFPSPYLFHLGAWPSTAAELRLCVLSFVEADEQVPQTNSACWLE